MHHEIHLASHVRPLIETIRELNVQAAASSGSMSAGNLATLNRLVTMADALEKGAHTLAIGLHTHASGVSPYAFAISQGAGFGAQDFEGYLEEAFEPHKEEFLDVFYPDNIEVLTPVEARSGECPNFGTEVTAADDQDD